MANIFERIIKAITSAGDAERGGAGYYVKDQDNAVLKRATKHAEDRILARKRSGATVNSADFFTGFSGMDDNARKKYMTSNSLVEQEMKSKYPDFTEEEFNTLRDNKIKKDFLKNSKNPSIRKLYNSWFDSNGQLNDIGRENWGNVNNIVA